MSAEEKKEKRKEKIFIGVAWPYANGPIHVGHVAGSLISPDIFARYNRMKGEEVLMVSGSDQHGTPITVTAEKEGLTPKEVAERYHEINKKCMEELGITFDLFLKTSHPAHKKVVHDIFLTLLEKGFIYKKTTMQPYCLKCARFLPDRYVEGECPYCHFENARGDQCDECGNTLDPEELINLRCKICTSKPEMRETEHFFFKLSAFEKPLLEYIKDKDYWRSNTINFTRNWIEGGLKDRAVTRDLKWGIDLPFEGFENKRIYVWFEAVMGYLSASMEWSRRIGEPDKWKEFWQDKGVKHYYFLGKDNIPFHTIYWPAMLLGHGNLNLPYDVPANEFLRYGGEQLSKSRGVTVDIPDILDKYDADALRYYLTAIMPELHDADFTWDEFDRKNNDELVATYGNFVHRVLTFAYKHFEKVPERGKLKDIDEEALKRIKEQISKTSDHIEKCQFKKGLKCIMDLAKFGNQYFDAKAPWSEIKNDKEACATTIYTCLRIVKALAVGFAPFLPFSSERLWHLLGYKNSVHEQHWDEAEKEIKIGQGLLKPEVLFKRIEERVEEKGLIRELEKVDMRIGEIVNIEQHPNADKLIILTVDLGDEKRKLVAGLKEHYDSNELINKKIVVVCNLQPVKLRGVESRGMLLAAQDERNIGVLTVDKKAKNGAEINGCKKGAKMISFDEFKMLDLRVGDIGDEGIKVGALILPIEKALPQKKCAVLMKGKEGILLKTKDDVLITLDKDIKNGSRIT